MSAAPVASPPGPRIHPTKRCAEKLAQIVPRSWRFPIFGLPPAPSASPKAMGIQIGPTFSSIDQGIACHLTANLDREGALINGVNPGLGNGIERRFLQRQRFFPKIRKVSGTAISFVGDAHTNYYHWLLETLPRLRFLKESPRSYDWFYTCQKESFHRESLSLLGCDPAQMIDSTRTPFLQANQLLVPRFLQPNEPWVIPWLQEQLREATRMDVNKELPRRLYISRQKAASRKLVNEPELLELLEAVGFVPLLLEDHSWLEQVTLFQQAEAIAGPHGAGFANLIFCSPGTLVMELKPQLHRYRVYEELSLSQKLDYRRIDVELLSPSDPGASDMRVNLRDVEEMLRNRVKLKTNSKLR